MTGKSGLNLDPRIPRSCNPPKQSATGFSLSTRHAVPKELRIRIDGSWRGFNGRDPHCPSMQRFRNVEMSQKWFGFAQRKRGTRIFFSWLVAQSPLATSHCRCQNLNENLVGQLHGRNGSQDHQPLKISRVLAQSMICRICMYHVVLILKHILHPVVALVARRTLPRISCHWNDDMIKMDWFS